MVVVVVMMEPGAAAGLFAISGETVMRPRAFNQALEVDLALMLGEGRSGCWETNPPLIA